MAAEVLLDVGADVNIQDSDGMIALHLAASRGHEELVRLLLEKRASISVPNSHGLTALQLAICSGHDHLARLLVEGRDTGGTLDYGRIVLEMRGQNGLRWKTAYLRAMELYESGSDSLDTPDDIKIARQTPFKSARAYHFTYAATPQAVVCPSGLSNATART